MVGRASQIGDIFRVCGTDAEVEVAGFDPEDPCRVLCLVTDSEGEGPEHEHKVWFRGDAVEFVRPGEEAQQNHPAKIETTVVARDVTSLWSGGYKIHEPHEIET